MSFSSIISSQRAPAAAVLLFCFATFLLTMRVNTESDSYFSFLEARQIATDFSLGLEESAGTRTLPGRDGRFYSRYPLGRTLLFLGPCFAGRLLERFFPPLDDGRSGMLHFLSGIENCLLAALGVLYFFRLLGLFGVSDGKRALACFTLAFTTEFWFYSRYFFPDAAAALCYSAVFYHLIVYARRGSAAELVKAALFSMAAASFKEHFILFSFAIAGGAAWQFRSRLRRDAAAWLAMFLLPAAALGITIAVNVWKFSDMPLGLPGAAVTGQVASITNESLILRGLFGLLFSPGLGVFWFNLALIPALWGLRDLKRAEPGALPFVAGIFILAIAFFGTRNWSAGGGFGTWGPRYLMAFLPIFMLPFGLLLKRIDLGWWRERVCAAAGFGIAFLLTLPSILIPMHVWQKTVEALGYTYRYAADSALFLPNLSKLYIGWHLLIALFLNRLDGRPQQLNLEALDGSMPIIDVGDFNEIWLWWLQPQPITRLLGAAFILFWLASAAYFIAVYRRAGRAQLS